MAEVINQENCKQSGKAESINGSTLKGMLQFAVEWLARSESDVNQLNVFPVPDGDTGTNMLLTMRSAIDELNSKSINRETTISDVTDAIAHGSLMGARGNSGVILCQIWRGIAKGLKGKIELNGEGLAAALVSGSRYAYEGIENPVEGTMLTVIKEMSSATQNQDCPVRDVLEVAVDAARKAVAGTPELLPVLKEAGVVDSGGQGLLILFEGALMYLDGENIQPETQKSHIIKAVTEESNQVEKIPDNEELPYGYCTEFLLRGEKLEPDEIRENLKSMGQSLIVINEDSIVKVHIHCLDPGLVLHYAVSLGTLSSISIRNMDEQHDEIRNKAAGTGSAAGGLAVIAIATGEGIIDVFRNLGVANVVQGGPSMNPSTKQILQAVEAASAGNVIILPNDKNLVLAARQVETLTDKKTGVIPALTIPQGIAAMLSFDPESDLETNLEAMQEALTPIRTLEVTRAVRSTSVNGFSIKKDQAIGLLDGKLLAAGDDMNEVISSLLEKIELEKAEIVSIYYGADIRKLDAEKIRGMMHGRNAKLNIDIIHGGQPLYHYIISIE